MVKDKLGRSKRILVPGTEYIPTKEEVEAEKEKRRQLIKRKTALLNRKAKLK